MAEDQQYAQNIVFFFLIIQRDVAAYVQTPFISQPGWNLEALLLRKSTLSAVTYYIFLDYVTGVCDRDERSARNCVWFKSIFYGTLLLE